MGGGFEGGFQNRANAFRGYAKEGLVLSSGYDRVVDIVSVFEPGIEN